MKNAKLIPFDDTTRVGHHHLGADDQCFYFIEYTARRPYSHSSANSFITNLKKSPKTRGTHQWRHKQNAIAEAVQTLESELPWEWIDSSTFIPVPPSKAKDDPEYDDRMTQVLSALPVDSRELVYQRYSMAATHESEERHSVEDLLDCYAIDEEYTEPTPEHIVIVDDMITAGSHYRAMARLIGGRFPEAPISGLFLARRIFADDHQEE